MNEWGEGGGEGVVCQAQYNPEGGRREKGGGGGGGGGGEGSVPTTIQP